MGREHREAGAPVDLKYASNHDWALERSKLFHMYKRAGDSKPDIEILPGVDPSTPPSWILSCLSWKWRKRSSVKIMERTYE
jgi:hypothetical protein